VYNGRGMAYLEMERYDKPVSDFETALTPDPGFSPAYFNRGEALYRSGDLDEAMKDFETSCELGYIKGCVCRDKIHKNRQ